jgi:hypothetical protein
MTRYLFQSVVIPRIIIPPFFSFSLFLLSSYDVGMTWPVNRRQNNVSMLFLYVIYHEGR